MNDLLIWAQDYPALAISAGVVALVLVLAVIRYGYGLTRAAVTRIKSNPPSVLTVIAAGIATVVAASGMWQFFERIMPGVDWYWRALMFAFIEVAVITSAVRARESMREHHTAGIDGTAVWALTGLSAILSTLEASSFPEGLFRLASPLVAAWLWERGMAVEHRRATGRARINWRVTPERIMVRLGLAEASDRTASEVDEHRRITRVALAAFRLRQLTPDPDTRKYRRAARRLNRVTARAVEHAALTDPERSAALMGQLGALYGAPALASVTPPAPWDVTVTRNVTPDPDPDPVTLTGWPVDLTPELFAIDPGDPVSVGHDPDPDPVTVPAPRPAPLCPVPVVTFSPPPSDPGDPVGPGHDPDPDPVTVPAALLSVTTDADRIRTALAVLGSDATPAGVMTWLTDQGVTVRPENVRTVLRRERTKVTPAGVIAPVLTLHKGSH